MKKVLSVILVLLMLVPLFAFNIVAEEQGAKEECTISDRNCASIANFSFGNAVWFTRKNELVDGDKSVGMAGSYSSSTASITMAFDEVHMFTNLVITVNSEGVLYGPKDEEQPKGFTNSNFKIDVEVYDQNNEKILSVAGLSTLDKAEIVVPVNAEAKKFVITYGANWSIHNAIWEIETFEQIGKHAWVLDEEASTPASCEDSGENVYNCQCGATKEEPVNAHTVEEWEIILAPTTLESGVAEGKCVVPGCDGWGSKVLPRLSLSDHEKKLGLGELRVEEDVKTIEGSNDTTKIPNVNRDPEALFDGIIDTDSYKPTNFWCGTGWTETNILSEDNPDTPDVDETVKESIPYYSTLTITFDKLYTLTQAEVYVYSNYNSFVVDFLDENGRVVRSFNKGNFQNDGFSKLNFTSDIYGVDVKSIVITIKSAKWEGGKGLAFTEFSLTAHECIYSDEDIASGTVNGCVTTFDGKCLRCTKERTGVPLVSHTFEKDSENPAEDKIVEVITEALCYRKGKIKKHCTACNEDVLVILDSTGNHEYGEVKVETKPTCGAIGYGYKECTVDGCKTRTETFELPPEGSHSYKWVEKEGFEADYTHDGLKINKCSVCGGIDEVSGTQVSKKLDAKFVAAKDWSIRYTDFTSPKATFKVSKSLVDKASEQFDVKIYGVVKKGDVTKEVQVYGEGATGKMQKDGTFSLVVKGGSYTDEYEFSVKVVITDREDGTSVTTITKSKPMTTSPDGNVSAADIAYYFVSNENKASLLEDAVKAFYDQIAAARK